MIPPIYALLKASSAVTAIVGSSPSRIYRHGDAPQSVTSPYVTWSVQSAAPQNELSGTPAADACACLLDCWATSDAGAVALGQAVRDALESACHITSMSGSRDYETGKYRWSIQFDYWLGR